MQGPMDNSPEVRVTSTVYDFRSGPDDGNPEHYELRVKYEARCKYGCGSLFSPDVVKIVNYVNDHVKTFGHMLAKSEKLHNDR